MEKTTGGVLKFLRKRADLSQEGLGEILGVKRVTIQKYENNTITLNVDTIRKLCNHFRVPPWIFVFPDVEETEIFLRAAEKHIGKLLLLNDAGIMRLLEYLSDLSMIDAYRRDQN